LTVKPGHLDVIMQFIFRFTGLQ